MAGMPQAATTRCVRCNRDIPDNAAFCPHCGTAAPGRVPGPRIPGYTIVRTLGKGGAAVEYLATQDSLGRQVAVKVLRREVEDPKQWRWFQREAKTIARLSGHPNVVTVFSAGTTEEGQPYLVTEHLDQGSLARQCPIGDAFDGLEAARL
jgi:serine/threonine protein kinase